MSHIPFVRFVGLNGSLARGCATKESDIDLIIIACPNRVYTVRFFATAILVLTRWRRRPRSVAGKICLNCFLSEDHLNIRPERKHDEQKVALSNLALVPLFDSYGVYDRFCAKNVWMSHYATENTKKSLPTNVVVKKHNVKRKKTGVGDLFERLQMNYQTARILRGKKPCDEIYVSANFIKLHPKK